MQMTEGDEPQAPGLSKVRHGISGQTCRAIDEAIACLPTMARFKHQQPGYPGPGIQPLKDQPLQASQGGGDDLVIRTLHTRRNCLHQELWRVPVDIRAPELTGGAKHDAGEIGSTQAVPVCQTDQPGTEQLVVKWPVPNRPNTTRTQRKISIDLQARVDLKEGPNRDL